MFSYLPNDSPSLPPWNRGKWWVPSGHVGSSVLQKKSEGMAAAGSRLCISDLQQKKSLFWRGLRRGYLAIGWLAGYLLAIYWMPIRWLLAIYRQAFSWQSVGNWMDIGCLSAGFQLSICWPWVDYGLAMGYPSAGYLLTISPNQKDNNNLLHYM